MNEKLIAVLRAEGEFQKDRLSKVILGDEFISAADALEQADKENTAKDARIAALEAENRELRQNSYTEDAVKALVDGKYAEIERLKADYDSLNKFERSQLEKLLAKNSRLQAELDAAVSAMKSIADEYRKKVGDDGICGLCEYDANHGIDGDANECPGFERDDCFKWCGPKKDAKGDAR